MLILAVAAVVWRPWTRWQSDLVGAQENGQSDEDSGSNAADEPSDPDTKGENLRTVPCDGSDTPIWKTPAD